MTGIYCSGSKFEFTRPVSVWLPLCSVHRQWQRHIRNHRENPGTSAKLKKEVCLPKEYWREYPLWAWPDDHFNSFWKMQQHGASELFTVLTPPALCSPTPVLAPDSLEAAVAVSGCSSGCETFSCATSPLRCHFTAQLKHLPRALSRSVTFCYSQSSNIKKLQDLIWSGADSIAILGFRKCHWTRIPGYIKDCFQTPKQLSESHFSSHSFQQIDASLPHLMSENSVSVSHTSWSASSLWTHSKPIS